MKSINMTQLFLAKSFDSQLLFTRVAEVNAINQGACTGSYWS
jgi:hypothetical protein